MSLLVGYFAFVIVPGIILGVALNKITWNWK